MLEFGPPRPRRDTSLVYDMLASLLRGHSGQKGSQYPESVTDDTHTRNLLFGQSEHVFNLTTSPPASPFGSPALRASSFDDYGGLELEEKDVRVLLAQDAYSGSAGPMLLFDSRKLVESGTSIGRGQHATRSQLPTNWKAPQSPTERAEEGFRSRSSTFSATQNTWAKVAKDKGPKEDPFLECMFGAPSSTKTTSSTKMHIIPARSRPISASDRLPRRPLDPVEPRRRAPLSRALTSGQQPTLSTLEDSNRDVLLITRLFHITLEDVADALVELKVPAFAVGFVLYLPYPSQRPSSAQSRTAFNPNAAAGVASATSSYGSDMQSSWTFLDAIPASLSSSMTFSDDGDRRVDAIVANWDVILRSISTFERVAAAIVTEQLQNILIRMPEPKNSHLKEKLMHRVTLAIHDASDISRVPSLPSTANDVSRRIVYGIRIPRVVTGLGVSAGHWKDEARMLYRSCGGRQQNFFLFNLLTAFLGNHMQWLERLAPEWYRKQFQANQKKPDETRVLVSRTIIVSENKGLARRLVYILASFLPGRSGIDGLQKASEESAIASSSSPSGNFSRSRFPRRPSKPSIRNAQIAGDSTNQMLSTSASSQASQGSTFLTRSPQKLLSRKDSNKFVVTKDAIISKSESDNKSIGKEAVGAISAAVPNSAATPTPYISSRRDNYFPESPLVDTNDSLASIDLAKVLHKASFSHRRTSSMSSRWGSLVSGISEIWSNKQATPGDRSSITTASQGGSPAEQHKRSGSSAVSIARANPLQMMVDELDAGQVAIRKHAESPSKQSALSPGRQSVRTFSATPRLHVDDKDGVVDVELDLPGFLSPTSVTPPQQAHNPSHAKTASFNRDCSDSICSFRSMATKPTLANEGEQVNVGGYLRRHHEDFVLHAVRPYPELMEEIKRAMKTEPTPQEVKEIVTQQAAPVWMSICTTLVADTKPFSIHRLTLRRQFEPKAPMRTRDQNTVTSDGQSMAGVNLLDEEITDEVVMEFDTTLADAVEKALNVGTADPARHSPASRAHSRNVSSSSVRGNTLSAASTQPDTQQSFGKAESAKADHRNPVVGALEDVVRSVNEDLNKAGQTREHEALRKSRTKPVQQENALREGVKNWMLNVEQTSVW